MCGVAAVEDCGVASVDECIVVRCVAAHSVMCRGAVLCSVMWQHSLVPRPLCSAHSNYQ